MTDHLRIVTAGAGSGKTYTIQKKLGEWIASGVVAPERIVAVTFTEAAAAELRERIGGELLGMGRIDEALRLSQAYISTIHSLGLRILTEFAFEASISPNPRLLNDDEENALVRRALAGTDKADRIIANLEAYGYTFNAWTVTSGEQAFRDALLEVVNRLRSIGATTPKQVRNLARQTQKRIKGFYGKADRERGQARELRRRVKMLLDRFPESLDADYATSRTAATAFRRDFRCLSQALRPGTLESDWSLWEQLRNIRISTRASPPPEPYLRLAEDVRDAANALLSHAGPLEQAMSHIHDLLTAGQDVLAHYERAKRRAGLVDYADMVAAAGQLLDEEPAVLKTLASRVDCLVVDEFQDTNPLQFDLLWRIARTGIRTLIVGDLKQAIMGFQGADPRLFEALESRHRLSSQALGRNWRSQPSLMDFVNALGPHLFGDQGYVKLDPQRDPSCMAPLEALEFRKASRKHWQRIRAYSVATRLKELLDDASQLVTDRRTGSRRRLRGSDIAVLCPTNQGAAAYAAVFRAVGLQVNHQSDGWLESRAVQIAWNALAYVASPSDRHAALSLSATEIGSLTLGEALGQLIDTGRIDDPVLRKLDRLAEGVADRTIYAVVADTVSALELFDVVSSWPDGEQARANLVRLMGEAAEFMDANREALAHGGYHGHGVETFLGWLAGRPDEDQQPEKSVIQEDAIALRTWHRAKGLEWPVVAVCNLDRSLRPRLPSLDLEYGSFDDLGSILRGARIDYWPSYAAREKRDEMTQILRSGLLRESRRLLYVALTRARDKLVLEWPAYQAKPQKKPTDSYWKLLKGVWSLDSSSDLLRVGQRKFRCAVVAGVTELPSGLNLDAGDPEAALPVAGRRAIRRAAVPADWTPDSVAASTLAFRDVAAGPADIQIWRYGAGLDVESDLSSTELGTYLHRCFEILGERPGFAGQVATLAGVTLPPGTEARIAHAVAQFEGWLRTQFKIESVLREWPVLALDENGTVVSGEVDLVVQTPEGIWVLDHKSDRFQTPEATFGKYEPQLAAYARALAGEGRTVLGIGLNLIRAGVVVWRRPDGTGGDHRQEQVRARARSEPSAIQAP